MKNDWDIERNIYWKREYNSVTKNLKHLNGSFCILYGLKYPESREFVPSLVNEMVFYTGH